MRCAFRDWLVRSFKGVSQKMAQGRMLMSIGGSNYLSTTKPVASAVIRPLDDTTQTSIGEGTFTTIPVTILRVQRSQELTTKWVNDQIANLQSLDDVICTDFLSTILFHTVSGEPLPQFVPSQCRGPYRFATCDTELPSGPYLWIGTSIYQVFKLYQDPYGAFMYGVVPSEDDVGSYQRIPSDLIPVPSRAYFPPPTDVRPLSGKRIAVKDIYDICGLKTSAGSRAYASLQEESKTTADSVKKLIDQGAVIVGKTKTTQFASGAGAIDWVDYQCPFNPRGCGYLDPDCSSSGSGVAIAAYPWVDFSIGSDSLGSMVGPAAANGIFGLRPTHGLLSLDGGILVSQLLDTPGHFSRNISEFSNFAKVWLSGALTPPMDVKRIIFPADRFMSLSQVQLAIVDSFITDLEKATGIQRTVFDLAPKFKSYLFHTVAHIQLYDCYHNGRKFHKDYETNFGRKAYLDPMVQYKTKAGAKVTNDDYVQAYIRKTEFQKYLLDHIVKERSILLLPIDTMTESYRDPVEKSFTLRAENYQGYGLKDTAFSVLGGLPCVSFPVDQTQYKSNHSQIYEYRPFSLMLLGPPGSDVQLIELLKQVLQSSHRPLEVNTGKTAFEM